MSPHKFAVTRIQPLQPCRSNHADSAWEKLAIDIVGPIIEVPVDCQLDITEMDHYSKLPEIVFVTNITSATAIFFIYTVFSEEGKPKVSIV